MKWRVAALVGLALLVSCGTNRGSAPSGSAGDPADFSFTTFEGKEFTAAEQRGTPVVLNFWESW